jgi:hypothetical protein
MENNKKSRRHHSPEDKVRILRLHLLEGKPISESVMPELDSTGIESTTLHLPSHSPENQPTVTYPT